MVAGIVAVGIVYGSTWVVRQAPKVGVMLTGLLLWKAKNENENLHRFTRLGFDIIRDMEDPTFGSRSFHAIRFSKEKLPDVLKFLGDVDLFLTSEEAFVLKKAMMAVRDGEPVVPINFKKFVEVSEARLNDERFMKSVSSKEA